ncbi:MAG: Spy/CpxP family protein refolding chaperone [Pseudomonadota bacterium]
MIKRIYTGTILRIAVALIGCMVAALPVSAFEGGRYRHHVEKGAEFGFGCLNQLDLTDVQKSGITEIMDRYRSQLDALRNDIHQARQQLQTAMNLQPFDEAQIKAAYETMSPLLENRVLINAKMKNEIRSLLTADQVTALEEKRASRCEKGRERCANRQAMTKCWLQPDADETP